MFRIFQQRIHSHETDKIAKNVHRQLENLSKLSIISDLRGRHEQSHEQSHEHKLEDDNTAAVASLIWRLLM